MFLNKTPFCFPPTAFLYSKKMWVCTAFFTLKILKLRLTSFPLNGVYVKSLTPFIKNVIDGDLECLNQ